MTKPLYTTSECEAFPGVGKVLLPGVSAPSATKVRKGDEIHLKLPDGRWLKTVADNYRTIDLAEAVAKHLNVTPGFYEVVVVPDEFLGVGFENGAEVYLVKPRHVAILDALERIKWDADECCLNPSDATELRKLKVSELMSRGFGEEKAEIISKGLMNGDYSLLGECLGLRLKIDSTASLLQE